MDNQAFEKKTKTWLCIMVTTGFVLIGFGIGVLLSCEIAAVSIGAGIGLLSSVILLVRNKHYEIENLTRTN